VFLLYSYLQANAQLNEGEFRGLGHVDSRKDILTVKLEFQPHDASEEPDPKSVKGRRRSHGKRAQKAVQKTLEIRLAQDKTALHSRKGDTGSVLWKARFGLKRCSLQDLAHSSLVLSVDFATMILQQFHTISSNNSFLNPSMLKNLHVVELGFAMC
jgi:protein N-lysine methyltransferase METTL21D